MDSVSWQGCLTGDQLILEERTRHFKRLLEEHGMDPRVARVLDIGCGTGHVLQSMLKLGFEAGNLTGIDVQKARLDIARRSLPAETTLICGDAAGADLAAESFDLILLFTVLSSMRERAAVARQAWRAAALGGAIAVYDMRVPNPFNRGVAPVSDKGLRRLFPEGSITQASLTVVPQIARMAPRLYKVLGSMPFLRTHNFYWISKL